MVLCCSIRCWGSRPDNLSLSGYFPVICAESGGDRGRVGHTTRRFANQKKKLKRKDVEKHTTSCDCGYQASYSSHVTCFKSSCVGGTSIFFVCITYSGYRRFLAHSAGTARRCSRGNLLLVLGLTAGAVFVEPIVPSSLPTMTRFFFPRIVTRGCIVAIAYIIHCHDDAATLPTYRAEPGRHCQRKRVLLYCSLYKVQKQQKKNSIRGYSPLFFS